MPTYDLGILYGDGIGYEIVGATVKLLDAVAGKSKDVAFNWVELPMGLEAIENHGHPLPEISKQKLAECHGWIMGPYDLGAYPPEFQEIRNPSGELRQHFDLYANIRPVKNYLNVKSVVHDTDLVIVRENSEGFYVDRNMYVGPGEWMPTPDVAVAMGVFTKRAAKRIAHVACQLAMTRQKHLTIVHKANVIKLSMGLFLETCREVANSYHEIRVDDYYIDAFTAHLVKRSSDFDVIVTTNMFGDILSDLAAELVGSLGIGCSLNAGKDFAMAQAAHGSAPDIAGKGICNPTGEFVSAAMLLEWLGNRHNDDNLLKFSQKINDSVASAFASGIFTADMGGEITTSAFTEAVIERLEK